MSGNELKEYFYVFNECGWKLFKKYSNPADDEEFWKRLTDEAEELIKKSRKPEDARRAVIATMDIIKAVHEENSRNSSEEEGGAGQCR